MNLILFCQRQDTQIVAKLDPRHEWHFPFCCADGFERQLNMGIKSGEYFALSLDVHRLKMKDFLELAKDRGLHMDELHDYYYETRKNMYGMELED